MLFRHNWHTQLSRFATSSLTVLEITGSKEAFSPAGILCEVPRPPDDLLLDPKAPEFFDLGAGRPGWAVFPGAGHGFEVPGAEREAAVLSDLESASLILAASSSS